MAKRIAYVGGYSHWAKEKGRWDNHAEKNGRIFTNGEENGYGFVNRAMTPLEVWRLYLKETQNTSKVTK